MKNIKTIISALLIIIGLYTMANDREDVYMSAMQEEIQRSMENLILERMLPPSFISYTISDANSLHVKATLGGIVKSVERPFVRFNNRIIVMRDGVSNENYVDENNVWGRGWRANNLPLTGDKDAVRRALWLTTDNNYKAALSNFESKVSARNRQNLTEEELKLVDFLLATKEEVLIPYSPLNYQKSHIESLAKAMSEVFADYKSIISSEVNFYVYDANVFFQNSEGTKTQYPFQVIGIIATALTQAPSGEELYEHFVYFTNDYSKLPSKNDLVKQTKDVANSLDVIAKTEVFSGHYSGPVLFEGQAAAEAFAQVFFGNIDGLVSVRKPIVGSEQVLRFMPDIAKENSLEARIGRRIISRDLSITALPRMNEYEGTNLIGAFNVDAEGISTKKSFSLVENGTLTNILSSRTPTLNINESNAHSRPALSMGELTNVVAPGVIKLSADESLSFDIKELKEMLIREAEDEGLEYAYIVRKVVSPIVDFANNQGGVIYFGQQQAKKDFSKTIQVYRIYVEDGREVPVSLSEIKGINIRSFRRILGASQQMQTYNTMFTPVNESLQKWGFSLTGTPVSYILPQALLFEELEIVRESQPMVKRPPVVSNPVKSK
jgi:hypothetical protein